MLSPIELRHIRYFIAVAEEGSLRRASERLHLSQPPLTRQIQRLESLIGCDLLVRTPRGVLLTAAGEAFLRAARGVVQSVDQAIEAARVGGRSPKLRFVLGCSSAFDRSAFPNAAAAFNASFPGWTLIEEDRSSVELVRALKRGRMDAAFIGLHTETKGLAAEIVHTEPFIVALPARHGCAKRSSVQLRELKDETLFWFERRLNPGFYDRVSELFDEVGFHPVTVPEPPEHHTLLGRIADGEGIALLPASLSRVRRRGVVFRSLSGAQRLQWGIMLAYRPDNASAQLSQFVERIRKLVRRGRRPDRQQEAKPRATAGGKSPVR